MPQNLTLYAIHGIENAWDDEPFDVSRLPFDLGYGVSIENVSGLLGEDAFSEYFVQEMGTRSVQRLKELRFALVHRYERFPIIVDGRIVAESGDDVSSIKLLRNTAACLRLIRPMRQDASLMYGSIMNDGTFEMGGFDHPYNLLETPQNQKHFNLRTRDAEELKARLPEFLRAMAGEFWKFRMSVQFHWTERLGAKGIGRTGQRAACQAGRPGPGAARHSETQRERAGPLAPSTQQAYSNEASAMTADEAIAARWREVGELQRDKVFFRLLRAFVRIGLTLHSCSAP
jgi:hypothetical protein